MITVLYTIIGFLIGAIIVIIHEMMEQRRKHQVRIKEFEDNIAALNKGSFEMADNYEQEFLSKDEKIQILREGYQNLKEDFDLLMKEHQEHHNYCLRNLNDMRHEALRAAGFEV